MIRPPPRSPLFPYPPLFRSVAATALPAPPPVARSCAQQPGPHRAPTHRPSRLPPPPGPRRRGRGVGDRKSTRLNSSHLVISYAVFCLKKKKRNDYVYGRVIA